MQECINKLLNTKRWFKKEEIPDIGTSLSLTDVKKKQKHTVVHLNGL